MVMSTGLTIQAVAPAPMLLMLHQLQIINARSWLGGAALGALLSSSSQSGIPLSCAPDCALCVQGDGGAGVHWAVLSATPAILAFRSLVRLTACCVCRLMEGLGCTGWSYQRLQPFWEWPRPP